MERTVYLQKIHVLWLISMGFLVAKYTSPIWMVWGKLVPVSTLVYLFCLRLNGCPKSLFSTPTTLGFFCLTKISVYFKSKWWFQWVYIIICTFLCRQRCSLLTHILSDDFRKHPHPLSLVVQVTLHVGDF